MSVRRAGSGFRPGACTGRDRGVIFSNRNLASERPASEKPSLKECPLPNPYPSQGPGLPRNWVVNQPYLLLCIATLGWAGNAIVGRLAAGHIPPVTLSFLRWSIAFLIILPFAWKHLKRDWGAIRAQLGMMIFISFSGIAIFNTLQYWALEYTQALNTLLLQSAGRCSSQYGR